MQQPAAGGSIEHSAAELHFEWVRKKRPPFLTVRFEYLMFAAGGYDTCFNTCVFGLIVYFALFYIILVSDLTITCHVVSFFFNSSSKAFNKRKQGIPLASEQKTTPLLKTWISNFSLRILLFLCVLFALWLIRDLGSNFVSP